MSGLGEMGNLLKQAQEMQRQLDNARTELKNRAVEGIGAGGLVRVTLSGDRQEVRGVHIASGVTLEARALEEAVAAAVRDALRRAAEAEKEAIGRITGGLNLPGLV